MKKRVLSVFLGVLVLICFITLTACFDETTSDCAHSAKEWVEAVDATCIKDGSVGHYTCPDCKKNFDADGNQLSDLTVKGEHTPASEWSFADGKHYHACVNCDAHVDEAACLGGTATCTDKAICEVCSNRYGKLAAHSYTVLKYNEDHHWSECACGAKEQLLCHVHALSETVSPDCTEGGHDLYLCTCGHTYKDGETPATNHIYKLSWTTNSAYHWHEASCGCETEISNYEQHSFVTTSTPATCLAQGYTTYTCSGCGYSYVSDYVNATGHSVAQWNEVSSQIFSAENCDYTVVYEGFCSSCETTVSKSEHVVRHALYERITTTANCQSEGVKSFFCSSDACKHNTIAHHTENYSDANAHVWVEDSSALNNGLKSYHCANDKCNATKKGTEGSSATLGKGEMGKVSEIEFLDAVIGLDQAIQNKWNGQSVQISAGTLDDDEKQNAMNQSNLSAEQKEQLAGCQIYSFTMVADQEISKLGGTATIRLPYTLGAGEDPNSVIVWYINNGVLTPVEAVYSEDENGAGFVTFKTDHFSYYTIDKIDPAKICEYFHKHDSARLLVVEATCTTGGYTICLRCGHQVEGSYVAPKGHNIGMTVITAATCDLNGLVAHACTDCGLTYEVATPAVGHYYALKEQLTASCSAAGSVTYACVHCNHSYTITTPKLSHSYHVTVIEPTCDMSGYTEQTCTRCGEVSRTAYVEAKGHVESAVWYANDKEHYHVCVTCGVTMRSEAHIPGAPATEQSAQICTVCEYILTLPLEHTHALARVEAVDPTCTTGGSIEYYTCSCGAWFKDEAGTQLISDHASVIIDAKGHTAVATDYVKPTCTTVGYTAGVLCSECNTYLRGHVEIAAYSHDYARIEKPATCTQEGSITYRCNHCGDTEGMPAETIPAREHRMSATTVAPNCTESGYTLLTCAYCDHSERTAVTEALGHSYSSVYLADESGHWHSCMRCDAVTATEAHTPDHTEATETHGIACVYCNYVIEQILSHDHVAVQTVEGVDPTCTTMGHKGYYVCACGEWFLDEACTQNIQNHSSVLIPALGHVNAIDPGMAPSCTEEGYSAGVFCKQCETWLSGHERLPIVDHDYYETYEFNDHGHYSLCKSCGIPSETVKHNFITETVEPTCEEGGYTIYTCICGHSYTGNATEALGHNFGEWVTNSDGTHSSRCLNDPAHVEIGSCQYETTVYEPTCTEGGYTEYICTICNHHEMRDHTEPHGHVMTGWESNDAGSHVRRCKYEMDGTCSYVEEEPCSYEELRKDSTCTEEGSVEKICTVCRYSFIAETIPAMGHSFKQGECEHCGELSDCIYEYEIEYPEQNGKIAIERLYFYRNGTAVDESYYRYADGTEELVNTSWVYWNEADGRIYVYIDEAHTTWVVTMLVREDGSIEQLVCKAHKFEIVDQKDATCTEGGYTRSQCQDCGAWSNERTLPLGHNMVSGVCDRCGASSGFAYTYEMDETMGDGSVYKIRYFFNHDGTVDAKIYQIVGGEEVYVYTTSAFWAEADGLVRIFANAERTDILSSMVVNNKGELEPYVCEKHDYVVIENTEPTCTEDGRYTEQCKNCGDTIGRGYPAIGHNIVDGVCQRCGIVVEIPGEPDIDKPDIDEPNDDKLENYRQEIIDTMDRELLKACESQSDYKKYQPLLLRYQKMVDKAESIESIDEIFNDYIDWIKNTFYSDNGSGEDEPGVEIPEQAIDEKLRKERLAEFSKQFTSLIDQGFEITDEDNSEYKRLVNAIQNAATMSEMNAFLDKANIFINEIVNRNSQGGEDVDMLEQHREYVLKQMKQLWSQITDIRLQAVNQAQYDMLYDNVKSECMTIEDIDVVFADFEAWINNLLHQQSGGTSLEAYRKKTLEHMDSLWTELAETVNIPEDYANRLSEMHGAVKEAKSTDEIKELRNQFDALAEEIRNMGASGEPGVDEPNEDKLENYRQEIADMMEKELLRACESQSDYEKYQPMLRRYQNMVYKSGSMEEIDEIFKDYTNWLKNTVSSDNGSVEDKPDSDYLEQRRSEVLMEMQNRFDALDHSSLNNYSEISAGYERWYKKVQNLQTIEEIEYEASEYYAWLDKMVESNGDNGGSVEPPIDHPVEPPVADDLENYRMHILDEMSYRWKELEAANRTLAVSYERSYQKKYVDTLKELTTIEEIEQLWNNFCQWIDRIMPQTPNVDRIELEKSNYQITEGSFADMKDFIESNVIGTNIRIYMTDGTESLIPITWDMIIFDNVSLDEIGDYEFRINYSSKNYFASYYLNVSVTKDMSSATFMGEYMMDLSTIGEDELIIQLYDNGYAVLIYPGEDDYQEVLPYEFVGNLICLETGDGAYVFELSEKGFATMYDPSKSEKVIAEYSADGMEITVYGKYSGAGKYFAVFNENNGKENFWLTLWVDYDHEARSMTSSMFGDSTVYFDENGELMIPNNSDDDMGEVIVPSQPGYDVEVNKPDNSFDPEYDSENGKVELPKVEYDDVVVVVPPTGANGDYVFNYGTMTDGNGNYSYADNEAISVNAVAQSSINNYN